MYRLGFLIFCIATSLAQTSNSTGSAFTTMGDPEALARSLRYVADSHDVITADGYILTMFRIQNATSLDRNLKPIVLQHGMGSNSGQWVSLGRQHSLAFILADRGFDVWLSNTRGTVHSRKHKTLSPDSAEFWDYSWHEIGVFDMPAFVDFILNSTSHKQLDYVGHSMGGTVFYVMTSMRPEYNKKIRQMFGFAPAGYMSNSPLRMIMSLDQLKSVEIAGRTLMKNHYEQDIILEKMTRYGLCKGMQYGCGQKEYFPFPDIITVGQFVHYGQQVYLQNAFRMYDFGLMNLYKYRALEPPRYPIERITVPMTIMYGTADFLSIYQDVERFGQDVPNAKLYKIPDPTFEHFSFAASPTAKDLVYKPMIENIIESQTHHTK